MKKYTKRPDGRYMKNILTDYGADGKLKFKSIYAETIEELEKKRRRLNRRRSAALYSISVWHKPSDFAKTPLERSSFRLADGKSNMEML